jgi:ABC-type uncharacterized transport system permease subunit
MTTAEATGSPLAGPPARSWSGIWKQARGSIGSVVIAVLASGLLLLAAGYDPVEALDYFFVRNFTSTTQISNLLVTTAPLLTLSISTIIAFRAGFWNIGQEGQLYLGACVGTIVGLQLTALGGPEIVLLALVTGALVGAGWALIAGALRAWLGVDPIVSTLMLNYVAILGTRYILGHGFQAPGLSVATETLPEKAWWPHLPGSTILTYGLVIPVLITAAAWFVLFRTTWGLRLRAAGGNARFAEAVGTSHARVIMLSAAASGAIAGIAGINLILSSQHQFVQALSPGYGWAGLAIALLARLNPFVAVFMALLYASLLNGSAALQIFTAVPGEFVNVVIGLIVVLVTAQWRRGEATRPVD